MFALVLLTTITSLRGEWYGESVDVSLLADGRAHVAVSMEMRTDFTTKGGYSELFPEDFRRLASTLELENMKMSLVRGAWRESWGPQRTPSPSATSITATLPEGNWNSLVSQLGGMTSCSLNHLGNTHEIPHVIASVVTINGTIHGYLPSEETFCTENFSPVLDLTPYKGSGGVAGFLSPMQFFRTRYHAIHVVFSSKPTPSLTVIVEFVDEPGISNSYKVTIPETCPLCTDNTIKASVHTPPDVETIDESSDGQRACGWESTFGSEMENGDYFVAAMRSPHMGMSSTQHGDGIGLLTWDVYNIDSSIGMVSLNILLPSRLLTTHISRMRLPAGCTFTVSKSNTDVVLHIEATNYTDGHLQITLPFEKHILPLDEYPPDANRLYQLPPSFATTTSDTHTTILYPPKPAVVTLPLPDFSMPFHIITLSCTALALLLGTIFTHVTKDFNA